MDVVKIMENPINPWMIWGDFTHHLRKHPSEFMSISCLNLYEDPVVQSFFSCADSQLKPEKTGGNITRWQAICSDVCGAFESFLENLSSGTG